MNPKKIVIECGPDDLGTRLDHLLVKKLPQFSRQYLIAAIKNGQIKYSVYDHLKPSTVIRAVGQLVYDVDASAELTASAQSDSEKDAMIEVFARVKKIFEDEDILVINKPAGMRVYHPETHVLGPGLVGAKPTVVDYLRSQGTQWSLLSNHNQKYSYRAGIVHRLDQDTSGVMVCCKNDFAHEKIASQFKQKNNQRFYLALCFGRVFAEKKVVESYLGRDSKNRKRFTGISKERYDEIRALNPDSKWRWAKTEFEAKVGFGEQLVLLRAKLFTGRTHQIRVHASSIGYPVVGDPLYGHKYNLSSRYYSLRIRKKIASLKRQMLHAQTLSLQHPRTGEQMMFDAPPPEDFQDIIKLLHDELVSSR